MDVPWNRVVNSMGIPYPPMELTWNLPFNFNEMSMVCSLTWMCQVRMRYHIHVKHPWCNIVVSLLRCQHIVVNGVVCTTVACNVMQCGGMWYPDPWHGTPCKCCCEYPYAWRFLVGKCEGNFEYYTTWGHAIVCNEWCMCRALCMCGFMYVQFHGTLGITSEWTIWQLNKYIWYRPWNFHGIPMGILCMDNYAY